MVQFLQYRIYLDEEYLQKFHYVIKNYCYCDQKIVKLSLSFFLRVSLTVK